MFAKISFDNKKEEELYDRAQKALKEFNQCYFELRKLGVVVFECEENSPNNDAK